MIRSFVARVIAPRTCDAKVCKVMSFKAPDRYDSETGAITPGAITDMFQTCAKRPGHTGEHGSTKSWRWIGRPRLRLANWIYP